MLSSVSLDAPPTSISPVVGFGSFGTSAPLPSSSGGACLTLQLRPEGSSQPIFAPSHFSGAVEKLRSSFSVSLISKPFQKYYWKAREGQSVQLDEDLLAKSVAAMISYLYKKKKKSVAAMRLPVSFTAKEATAMLPVKVSVGVADSVKDIVNPYFSKKGFLQRGFLSPSPAVKVYTHASHLESVVSSSTLDVKEDGVIGLPSPLSGCVTPIFEKGNEFRVNDLSQSQKWLVGFDLSREVVVWEQGDKIWDGEAGDSSYPLGVLPPSMALDWEVDSAEDEDLSLAILDAFEEDFLQKVSLHTQSLKAGGRF